MTPAQLSAALFVAAIGLVACTPTLNWREIQPEGSELFAMFPCKPERFARGVPLAGDKVEMRMSSCVVDGVTFAVAYAKVPDPAKVAAALTELREAAARNIGGATTGGGPGSVPRMTPNPLAQPVALTGPGADGKARQEHAAFFVKGLRGYQAAVVGAKSDP